MSTTVWSTADQQRAERGRPAAPQGTRLEMEIEILRRAAAYFAQATLPK